MTIDTSIYNQIQQPNALQIAGNAINLNDNLLALNAQKALPNILQSARDPDTGNLDANKLRLAVSNSPYAAKLQPYTEQAIKNETAGTELSGLQNANNALAQNTVNGHTDFQGVRQAISASGSGATQAATNQNTQQLNLQANRQAITDENGNVKYYEPQDVVGTPVSRIIYTGKNNPDGSPINKIAPTAFGAANGAPTVDPAHLQTNYDNSASHVNTLTALSENPNLTYDDVQEAVMDERANGTINDAQAAAFLKGAMDSQGNTLEGDPLKKLISDHLDKLNQAIGQTQAAYGPPHIVKAITTAATTPLLAATSGVPTSAPSVATQQAMKQGGSELDALPQEVTTGNNQLDSLNKVKALLEKTSTGPLADKAKNIGGIAEELFGKGGSTFTGDNGTDLSLIDKDLERFMNSNPQLKNMTDYQQVHQRIANGTIQTPTEALKQLVSTNLTYAAEPGMKSQAMTDTLGSKPNPADAHIFLNAWNNARNPQAMQFVAMSPQEQDAYFNRPTTNKKELVSNLKKMESMDTGLKNPDGSPELLDMTKYMVK